MMSDSPIVSLILPIRNEADYIERCLDAVSKQTYPHDNLEVILVDGMSEDGTRDLVDNWCNGQSEFYLIDNPERIVPTGMNRALRQARGEIVVRVDGHCEIAPDYVRQCVHHLQTSGADGVGGPIETIGETTTAQAIALAMSSWFGMGGSSFRTIKDRTMWVETVAFPAYKMETVRKLGLYDEELVRNQDDEYNYRLLKGGGRILLTPDIHSRYYGRSSLRKLWRQFYQYGFWKVRVMQKHPLQMRWRQFVPFAFVLSLLATAILPAGWALFTTILLVYGVANLLAASGIARKNGWRYFPSALAAYPAMHVAYGLGFLVGLVRFAGRWDDRNGGVPPW